MDCDQKAVHQPKTIEDQQSKAQSDEAAYCPSQQQAISTIAYWNEAHRQPYWEQEEGTPAFNKEPTTRERTWFLAMTGVELLCALLVLGLGYALMAMSSWTSTQGSLMLTSGAMELVIALFLFACSTRARYTTASLMLGTLVCIGSVLFHLVLLVAVLINVLMRRDLEASQLHVWPADTLLLVAAFGIYVLLACALIVLSVMHFLLHIRFCHYHFAMPDDEIITGVHRNREASVVSIIDVL